MLLKKHFWLLSMLKTVQHNIFVETVIDLIFGESEYFCIVSQFLQK